MILIGNYCILKPSQPYTFQFQFQFFFGYEFRESEREILCRQEICKNIKIGMQFIQFIFIRFHTRDSFTTRSSVAVRNNHSPLIHSSVID